jgi:hypothetical protein
LEKDDRTYDGNEYLENSSYNPFGIIHSIFQNNPNLVKALSPGDAIQVCTSYKNEVGVDNNILWLVKPIVGTQGTINAKCVETLMSRANNMAVNSKANVWSSTDGVNIDLIEILTTWKFKKPKEVSVDLALMKDTKEKLKEFLQQENQYGTNFDVLTRPLSSMKKADREEFVAEKEKLFDVMQKSYELSLVASLLEKYHKGVLFTNEADGYSYSVEDMRQRLETNNDRQHYIDSLDGNIRYVDNIRLKYRGGLFGDCLIQIADLLGNKKYAQRSTFKKLQDEIQQKVHNHQVRELKMKCLDIVLDTFDKITDLRKKFENDKSQYSEDVINNTYTKFAEINNLLISMKDAMITATDSDEMFQAIFYRYLK